MRVAIFTDNDFDKVNGVTTTLQSVLRFAGDTQARIYTAGDLGVTSDEYFATASIGISLPWYREMRIYWPRVRTFARELIANGVDVIHVTTPGPVGLAGRWLASRLHVPLVGSYHTNLGDYAATFSGSKRLGGALETFMRWCYAPCDPLLVPSSATQQLLVDRGYRADRLKVWGRGVDVDRFRPTRASRWLRDVWHVDERRLAILYAGRLSREKGLDVIEPVQQELRRLGVAHQLVFAGDGPMRAALQEMCPGAVFLGTLSHDDVAVAMASADVFLFPSATDTLGNVVLEAQAAGVPVVVSDCGGPAQHLQPGSTGLVCEAGNPTAFANAIAELARNADRRAAMGRSAREYAHARDWPTSLAPLFEAWDGAARRATATIGHPSVRNGRRPAISEPTR